MVTAEATIQLTANAPYLLPPLRNSSLKLLIHSQDHNDAIIWQIRLKFRPEGSSYIQMHSGQFESCMNCIRYELYLITGESVIFTVNFQISDFAVRGLCVRLHVRPCGAVVGSV